MMDARFSTARQFYRIEGDQPPMQNLATGQPENLRSGNVSTWRMGQWGPHGFCRVLMSASGQKLTLRRPHMRSASCHKRKSETDLRGNLNLPQHRSDQSQMTG